MTTPTRVYTQGWFYSAPESSAPTPIYTHGWFEALATILTATVVNSGQVDLTWTLPTIPMTEFSVERQPIGTLPLQDDWGTLATLPPGTLSFSDEFAWPGEVLDYRIIVVNIGVDVGNSNVESVETPAPAPIPVGPPPVIDPDPVRNRLDPLEVSFLSPNVYGLEVGPDGSVVGYKY